MNEMTNAQKTNELELKKLEAELKLDDAKAALDKAEGAVILDDAGYAACKSNERDAYVARKTAKEAEEVRLLKQAVMIATVAFNGAERLYKDERNKLIGKAGANL